MTDHDPAHVPLSYSWKPAASLLLLLLFGLSACSFPLYGLHKTTPRIDPESLQRRLYDVGLPLLAAAVEWCPFERDATYGFLLRDRPVAGDAVDPGTRTVPVVASLHPRLPAASGGLAVGDRIIEVNTTRVEADRAEAIAQRIHRLTAARIQPLQLEIAHEGVRRTVLLWAQPVCNFALHLLDSDVINGASNGRIMAVTTGAMQSFIQDDELAWILAHELAHNILSHGQNAQLRMMLNTFLRATAAGGQLPDQPSPEPRSLEAQADYVGAYLMARAGYDLDAVERVWEQMRRLEGRQPAGQRGISHTHPTTVERLAAFHRTRGEIEAKRRRRELLQPQFAPVE